MNHPFPALLPLLRKIYASRFSELLFLVPFHRCDDPDVVTVYRGSYQHSGYVTDAVSRLARIECDHIIFTHDDVLLNPNLNERNFYEFFPLGSDDGFIPDFVPLHRGFGDWIFQMGHVARWMFPKSILFGTGVDRANLLSYLAPLNIKVDDNRANAKVNFSPENMTDIEHKPTHFLLEGLSGSRSHDDERTAEVMRLSRDTLDSLRGAMLTTLQHSTDRSTEVDTIIPMVLSGFYTDFYVIPKTKLRDFAHFIGICSAGGMFVEISTPTVLLSVCSSLQTACRLGLDFTGFVNQGSLESFGDHRFMALHPYKMSKYLADPDELKSFLEQLETYGPAPISAS